MSNISNHNLTAHLKINFNFANIFSNLTSNNKTCCTKKGNNMQIHFCVWTFSFSIYRKEIWKDNFRVQFLTQIVSPVCVNKIRRKKKNPRCGRSLLLLESSQCRRLCWVDSGELHRVRASPRQTVFSLRRLLVGSRDSAAALDYILFRDRFHFRRDIWLSLSLRFILLFLSSSFILFPSRFKSE